MYQRGIRGAITVNSNTIEDVKTATVELLTELKKRNNYKEEDISNVVFTLTDDIDCVYPALISLNYIFCETSASSPERSCYLYAKV